MPVGLKKLSHHVVREPVRGLYSRELWWPQDAESRSWLTDSNKVGASVLQEQRTTMSAWKRTASSQKEQSLADIYTEAMTHRNCKMINVCYFKPLNLRYFVTQHRKLINHPRLSKVFYK